MKIKKVNAVIANKEKPYEELEMNWYDMPGALDFENNSDFIAKLDDDAVHEEMARENASGRNTKAPREHSWARNNNHKKKLLRRRLTECPYEIDKDEVDAKHFLSQNGEKLQLHSDVKSTYAQFFYVSTSKKDDKKLTNSRIRHYPVDEGITPHHSYLKKLYKPNDV